MRDIARHGFLDVWGMNGARRGSATNAEIKSFAHVTAVAKQVVLMLSPGTCKNLMLETAAA